MGIIQLIKQPILITALLILSSCGGGGSSTGEPPVNTNKTIPEILSDAVDQGVDGIFVYVIASDGSETSYVDGIQNRNTQQAANAEAEFKIASISKLYIAVSAAKIANQGLIQLDDTLAQWLPEYQNRIENADSISIRQMLEHRSGIPDFDSQAGFSWESAHTDIDATLEFALDLPADFAPNANYEYSNTNYLLIAKILDAALGYSHHDYVKINIIDSLALMNTYSLLAQADANQMAHGYWNNVDRIAQDYVIPGGSMVSTLKDTALFLRALNAGNLLSDAEKQHYVYFYNHSGWVPGYQSIAAYHADIGATVVQFVNTTGGSSESIASQTYNQILDVLRN